MRGVPVAPAKVLRFSTEKSPSGACGANACHAATTACASDQDHSSVKVETLPTAWVRKRRRVTIPKFPPPPPRRAQYRSSCWRELQTTARPFARTTVAATRLSDVSPNLRAAKPIPPPSASPATPTVGHVPAGTVSPCPQRRSYTSISLAPAPTTARLLPSSATPFIRDTSTITPGVVE